MTDLEMALAIAVALLLVQGAAKASSGATPPTPIGPRPVPQSQVPIWLPVQRRGIVISDVLAQWIPGSGRPAEFPLLKTPPEFWDDDKGVWVFRAGGALSDWRPPSAPDIEPADQVVQS